MNERRTKGLGGSAAIAALVCFSAVATACSDEESAPKGGDSEGPLYLAGTRVWDDTTTTSYFHVISSLEPGTSVDASRALEVPGAAKLYAVEGLGWFAVGDGEAPTITRYTLDADGQLVAGDRISLQAYGVHDLWDTLYVVSDTKAYYPDRAGAQLIVWNPTSMEITGTVALDETVRDGYLALYSYTPVVRGDKLFFSVGWFDWESNDTILDSTGLVVLDTETDTVSRFDVDERCGGISQTVVLPSGDAYFVSSALAAAAHRLERLATEPCALRIAAGEEAFDRDYAIHLADLTEGALAGEPVPTGSDTLFLRVLDDAMVEVETATRSWDITGQSAWRWVRWNLATNEVTDVADLTPSTADVIWFQVDGRVFGTATKSDYAQTTLFELPPSGNPRTAATLPGFLHGLARIR